MTQEELNARAAESLKAQWLAAPNRTFVVEKKEKD